jgi:hypothetical protein
MAVPKTLHIAIILTFLALFTLAPTLGQRWMASPMGNEAITP